MVCNPNRMNENKKGKPYSFPDSFILIIGYMRIYFHLPYRQTEGLIKSAGKNLLPIYPNVIHRFASEEEEEEEEEEE